MPFQKPVDRRKHRKADGMRLSRRFHHGQKRRKHSDAGHKGDQHADARNLSKLGEAAVVSRQKRAEADRRRNGSQRQRRTGFPGGAEQSGAEIGMVMALGAITDTELKPKVDAEADEKHKKGH